MYWRTRTLGGSPSISHAFRGGMYTFTRCTGPLAVVSLRHIPYPRRCSGSGILAILSSGRRSLCTITATPALVCAWCRFIVTFFPDLVLLAGSEL
eukprot:9499769-Pyramimonas_sp.AAC.3